MPRVRQVAYIVGRAQKAATLERILDMEDPVATLVFCRTRLEVESLVETCNAHGHRAEALHGGMMQKQRDRVMGLFRAQKANLLIATDVAARGLDIEHISHVVNYDVPASPEVYLHRIGRTGRAGRGGTAITLAEPREQRHLRSIEGFTKAKLEIGKVPTVADLRAQASRADAGVASRAARRRRFRRRAGRGGIAVGRVRSRRHRGGGGEDGARRARRERGDERFPPSRPGAGGKPARARARRRRRRERRLRDKPRLRRARKCAAANGDGNDVRLFVGAGRDAGIRPGDLVGAITGEADVPSRSLGAIEIADKFSLVEVPEALADRIIAALKATKIRGKKVNVRREKTI